MLKSQKKNFLLTVLTILVVHFLFVFAKASIEKPATIKETLHSDSLSIVKENEGKSRYLSLYEELELSNLGLSKQAYEYAIKGYQLLSVQGKIKKDNILSIVDFSQPSRNKRLYVIDLKNNKVLFNTFVSHGRNSGREMAKEFSNQPESFKSSLGFFITGETYTGKHGYSLRLLGEEKGINDNALSRAIVMHSAAYVSEYVAKSQGYVGRSLGCPALPVDLYKPIIENIKGGSCLFLYSPDKYYVSHSNILKQLA